MTVLPYDLTTSEAAELIGVHAETLKRWAVAGKVAGLKTPGGRWRFRRTDLEAFLLAHATTVEPEPKAAVG